MTTAKNRVLKLSTCGSVDDGKSTLIGRLLYDTNSLPTDKLEAIERNSQQRGYDYLDFSLATDGLVAEREQGITIDVAHIYFSTPQCSYVIADTPGHKEYTRNMVTGASTSQVAIILIDARHGVVEQTKRHFFIHNLLRTKAVIVAVNKMDLVDYDQARYDQITADFEALRAHTTFPHQAVSYVPVSALKGDNVVQRSEVMSWYQGPSLLDFLEAIEGESIKDKAQARFQVQTVIRPKTEAYHDFRGYAGKLTGGELAIGDAITVLPSGHQSTVKEIFFYNQNYERAANGSSITVTLTDDINLSRGDILVKSDELPSERKQVEATVCWMDKQPLVPHKLYHLQHGVKRVKAKVEAVHHQLDVAELGEQQATETLALNAIGAVRLKLAQPIYADSFKVNKQNGAFILIDPQTHMTAGVGFVD